MAAAQSQTLTFSWTGKNERGKIVQGELDALNLGQARARLRNRGIRPLKVQKKTKSLFSKSGKKITASDIAIFSRQMATMMSSGVPLVQSFDIVGQGHENPSMQEMIMAIKGDVEAGGTLAEALAKHPHQFDSLYISLIAAGEKAGILESLLHKIAVYKEKSEQMKRKIKKAMIYPSMVLGVAGLVITILLVFVIPQFEELFANFGADLPALTKLVVSASEFMQKYILLIIIAVTAMIMIPMRLRKTSKNFARFLDKLSLRLPIMGPILNKSAIARFCRTLATMFAAGTPLVEAMTSVAGACGNAIYYDATMEMRDEISTGTQLQSAMRDTKLFPNMVVQMVSIGEEAGSLDEMLGKVADFYEDEVDALVESLQAMMEPIIIVFLGGIVGTMVTAMYLPIFKLGQAI